MGRANESNGIDKSKAENSRFFFLFQFSAVCLLLVPAMHKTILSHFCLVFV